MDSSKNSSINIGLTVEEMGPILIVHKPSGIHSTGKGETVENLLKYTYPNSQLIQRLDFETSGGMIATKDSDYFSLLKDIQKQNLFKKEYLVVVPHVSWETAGGSVWLGGRYRRSKKVSSSLTGDFPRAEQSKSHFSVEKHVTDTFSVVRASLTKGLRHQVRAHLAALGSPLIGDALYGSTMRLPDALCAPKFILHAISLSLPALDFLGGKSLDIEIPIPRYLQELLR